MIEITHPRRPQTRPKAKQKMKRCGAHKRFCGKLLRERSELVVMNFDDERSAS